MYRFFNRNCNCCPNMQVTNNAIETICDEQQNCSEEYEKCNCGFDEEANVFPMNPMLAQSYVPMQFMDNTFTPCCGLKNGTIFPELATTYYPCQSMRTLEYIRDRNTIGKGCNTCY